MGVSRLLKLSLLRHIENFEGQITVLLELHGSPPVEGSRKNFKTAKNFVSPRKHEGLKIRPRLFQIYRV